MLLDRRIINTIDLKQGQSVADLGAGRGDVSVQFANVIGQTGKVYAVDVNSRALKTVKKKVGRKGLENRVTLVLAEDKTCNLPPESVDLIFSRNAFHHFAKPVELFRQAKAALKPGGKVVIIDYREKSGLISAIGHCATEKRIDSVMEQAGFSKINSYVDLPKQHFVVYA